MASTNVEPTCPICKNKIKTYHIAGISAVDKTKYHYSCLMGGEPPKL